MFLQRNGFIGNPNKSFNYFETQVDNLYLLTIYISK